MLPLQKYVPLHAIEAARSIKIKKIKEQQQQHRVPSPMRNEFLNVAELRSWFLCSFYWLWSQNNGTSHRT